MNAAPVRSLRKWLKDHPPTEVHEGLCVGGDGQFSDAVLYTFEGQVTPYHVGHPSNIRSTQLGYCYRQRCDEIRPELPPLKRNHNIVNAVDVLLVGPKGPEELRSGTWACCRYARKKGKPVVIFWPNGDVTEERMGSCQNLPKQS
jgi:hypothetical protein